MDVPAIENLIRTVSCGIDPGSTRLLAGQLAAVADMAGRTVRMDPRTIAATLHSGFYALPEVDDEVLVLFRHLSAIQANLRNRPNLPVASLARYIDTLAAVYATRLPTAKLH